MCPHCVALYAFSALTLADTLVVVARPMVSRALARLHRTEPRYGNGNPTDGR